MYNDDDRHDLASQIRWRATTGFPSPAEDFFSAQPLDLNRLLIERPAASYFMLVSGDGLRFRGIVEGDMLIVDRAAPLKHQSVVVVALEDELLLRVIDWDGSTVRLLTGSSDAAPQVVPPGSSFQIWGVVTNIIRPLVRPFPHSFWKNVQS